MKATNLTFEQLKKELNKNKYVLLFENNWPFIITVNCKAALLFEKKASYNPLDFSRFYLAVPCSLHAVISIRNTESFIKK
jgi:hypothetical protein